MAGITYATATGYNNLTTGLLAITGGEQTMYLWPLLVSAMCGPQYGLALQALDCTRELLGTTKKLTSTPI